jgi:hypothetical protein
LQQKDVTKNIDVSHDTSNGSRGDVTMKTLNEKGTTYKQLGVIAIHGKAAVPRKVPTNTQ